MRRSREPFGRGKSESRRRPWGRGREQRNPLDPSVDESYRKMQADMKPKPKHLFLGFAAFISGYSILWGIAHLVMRLASHRWDIPTTVREYVTLILTFFLFGCVITLARLIFKPDFRAMQTMATIIDAMRRMSKGDFKINVEIHPRYAGQFYEVVTSLNRMAVELGQIEEMRQQFVSNVSHEIQSPLTSIKGFAQALQQNQLTEEQQNRYLKIIETECERLSKLSDNLLKLTSLESEHPPYQPKPFRLDRQLRQVAIACEPQWVGKHIELEMQLDETELEADAELLNQVWVNLLHNSIKFTPDSGSILISMARINDKVEVTFADTGIGIDPTDLPRLFERFYKADKARNRASGGSGLGLSIVHKIVQIHQGSIHVESILGQGTTIKVSLPLHVH